MDQTQMDMDLADIIHLASAVSWGLSLEKALSKGGTAWVPVITGAAGHLLAWQMKKNQNAQGTAMPQF